jgi:hypothetical protein
MGKNYNETVVLGRLKNDPIRVFHDDRTKDYVKFFICRENNDGTVDEKIPLENKDFCAKSTLFLPSSLYNGFINHLKARFNMMLQSLWALAASACFSLMAVFVKFCTDHFGSMELVFYRSLVGIIMNAILPGKDYDFDAREADGSISAAATTVPPQPSAHPMTREGAEEVEKLE